VSEDQKSLAAAPLPSAQSPKSRLGFGCVALTAFPTVRAAHRLLDCAFEAGVTHFDTAPIYGQGYSELVLGKFLAKHRGQVTVATKFGMAPRRPPLLPAAIALWLNALRKKPPAVQSQPSEEDRAQTDAFVCRRKITRAQVLAQFEASRRALKIDTIDIYLLHEGLPATLEPAAMDALRELKSKGLVRKLGLATNGRYYLNLQAAEIAEWDILQYESGAAWPEHDSLLQLFPDKMHIFHSCLHGIPKTNATPAVVKLLTARLAGNPSGKVLFSSKSVDHIRQTLAAL
jgi:aryl-alcohol dehydrogenase-like predicted oxidoreductase